MSFIFRIPIKGFLCPLFFVFLLKDSFVLYKSHLKMPENLKNIPKNLENL
jgi:hypothetical protein